MGFLSLYDQTERLEVAEGYWVEIKQHLSGDEDDACTRALLGPEGTQMHSQSNGQSREQTAAAIRARLDQAAYQRELMAASIVGWNLTDQNDQALPLAPANAKRASIARLPQVVRDQITARLLEIQDEHRRERQNRTTFRGQVVGGDLDGSPISGTAGAEPVPGGTGLVAEAWPSEI